MSHPKAPQRQPTVSETKNYSKALHNTALVVLVACPAIALIPPRKLDFYTVGLIGGTVYSANFLVRERTGRNIWQDLRQKERPTEHSVVSQTEQAKRDLYSGLDDMKRLRNETAPVTEEVRHQREVWKTQREKEIKDDLDEGKGLSDMIYDQIWDVWNWGKKKEDEDKNE